jgi:hypothetical protein
MYEEAINQLESMGAPFVENEDGTIVIDISEQAGTTVADIVGFLNENMIEYTIEGSNITVLSIGEAAEEEEDVDMTAKAEEELMGML